MPSEQANLYELAFTSWLTEKRVPFIIIDQSKRFATIDEGVKNFDFLLFPDSDCPVLVEMKGRTFHGATLKGLTGLDGWVPFEDVQALAHWQDVFRREKGDCAAVFVFAFVFEQIDVETDGRPVYDFDDRRFLLLATPLEKYKAAMKPRSEKWQTVTVSAADFRRIAAPVKEIIEPRMNMDLNIRHRGHREQRG